MLWSLRFRFKDVDGFVRHLLSNKQRHSASEQQKSRRSQCGVGRCGHCAPGSEACVAAFLQRPWELGQKPVAKAGRGPRGSPLHQMGTVAMRAIEPEAGPVPWAPGPGALAWPPASGSPRLLPPGLGSRHLLPWPTPPLTWLSVRVSQRVSLRLPYCVFLPHSQLECCPSRGSPIQTLAAATHRTHSGTRAAGRPPRPGQHPSLSPHPQPLSPPRLPASSLSALRNRWP